MRSKIKSSLRFKEGTASHLESISQLADQIKKFILKHKETPNSTVNDLAIGFFIGTSEAFANDNNPETTGLNMLDKILTKIKALMKEYDDLIPEEGEDFNLTDEKEKEIQTTLDDFEDEDSEEEDEDSEEEEEDNEEL